MSFMAARGIQVRHHKGLITNEQEEIGMRETKNGFWGSYPQESFERKADIFHFFWIPLSMDLVEFWREWERTSSTQESETVWGNKKSTGQRWQRTVGPVVH